MALAALALSFAIAGTAIAGPDALSRAIGKSKVKAIAKKQADKQITSRASDLSVANAENAQTAVSADPAAFAHVAANGVVDGANSKNVGQANVSNGNIPGYYCFSGLPFAPRGGIATIDWNGGNLDSLVTVGLGAGTECPAGTQLFVDTRLSDGSGSAPAAFFIVLYD